MQINRFPVVLRGTWKQNFWGEVWSVEQSQSLWGRLHLKVPAVTCWWDRRTKMPFMSFIYNNCMLSTGLSWRDENLIEYQREVLWPTHISSCIFSVYLMRPWRLLAHKQHAVFQSFDLSLLHKCSRAELHMKLSGLTNWFKLWYKLQQDQFYTHCRHHRPKEKIWF